MISSTVRTFISDLKSEVEAYKSLNQILIGEKEALLKWDVDAATIILFEKDELVSKIKVLEQLRTDSAIAVGNELFPGAYLQSPPTLKNIIEKLDDDSAADLSAFRDNQIELIKNVRNLNAHNSLLMKKTVEIISGSISAMTADDSISSTYDQNGKYKESVNSPKLIDGTI
ncbi:MAG: flagellar protein FlgN [Thaumarchaeota archaeon]|nr:flagellar protein FlgN [Nitrososphaerota archaeon]MCH8927731.1 flagellar protein FlgN [Candidatus Neomarinimicrobiota bacterium]